MKLKEYLSNTSFQIGILAVFCLLTIVYAIWITAEYRTTVKEAEILQAESARLHNESILKETEANGLRRQVEILSRERIEAKQLFEQSLAKAKAGKVVVIERRTEYDKVRNSPIVINPDGVDERERQLLTDFRELYKDK